MKDQVPVRQAKLSAQCPGSQLRGSRRGEPVDQSPLGPTSPTAHNELKPYRTPYVSTIAKVDELLDVLGPAQANYGGTGFS